MIRSRIKVRNAAASNSVEFQAASVAARNPFLKRILK
jgi:hypothetical protein